MSVTDRSAQDRHGNELACTFRILALTAQCDPFPRVSIKADRAEDVAAMAIERIYALHGLQVTREQLLVERRPFILPPCSSNG